MATTNLHPTNGTLRKLTIGAITTALGLLLTYAAWTTGEVYRTTYNAVEENKAAIAAIEEELRKMAEAVQDRNVRVATLHGEVQLLTAKVAELDRRIDRLNRLLEQEIDRR